MPSIDSHLIKTDNIGLLDEVFQLAVILKKVLSMSNEVTRTLFCQEIKMKDYLIQYAPYYWTFSL